MYRVLQPVHRSLLHHDGVCCAAPRRRGRGKKFCHAFQGHAAASNATIRVGRSVAEQRLRRVAGIGEAMIS